MANLLENLTSRILGRSNNPAPRPNVSSPNLNDNPVPTVSQESEWARQRDQEFQQMEEGVQRPFSREYRERVVQGNTGLPRTSTSIEMSSEFVDLPSRVAPAGVTWSVPLDASTPRTAHSRSNVAVSSAPPLWGSQSTQNQGESSSFQRGMGDTVPSFNQAAGGFNASSYSNLNRGNPSLTGSGNQDQYNFVPSNRLQVGSGLPLSFQDDMADIRDQLSRLSASGNPLRASASQGDALLQSFLKCQKPKLPGFDAQDSDTWLDITEKRLDDFGVVDSHTRYQLMLGTFTNKELKKLNPFINLGTRDQFYENLKKGIVKLFSPTENEKVALAWELKYNENDLPSTLANELSTLLKPQGFPDVTIKKILQNKLPITLKGLLSSHIDKPLSEFVHEADKVYINTRVDRYSKSLSVSQNATDPDLSKKDLTMLQMLVNLQEGLKEQSTRLSQLAQSQPAVQSSSMSQGQHSGHQYGQNSGHQHPPNNTSGYQHPNNNYGSAGNFRRNFKEITDVSKICFLHQRHGLNCRSCKGPPCVWEANHNRFCDKHRTFGIGAHFCVRPCAWADFVKEDTVQKNM